jgi:hypothetical protein
MSGRGRFNNRSEKTRAGREAIAGEIDGSRSIRIGFRAGRVFVRYSRKGARAGFSCLSAVLLLGLEQADGRRGAASPEKRVPVERREWKQGRLGKAMRRKENSPGVWQYQQSQLIPTDHSPLHPSLYYSQLLI